MTLLSYFKFSDDKLYINKIKKKLSVNNSPPFIVAHNLMAGTQYRGPALANVGARSNVGYLLGTTGKWQSLT